MTRVSSVVMLIIALLAAPLAGEASGSDDFQAAFAALR
jgi:hypothetical protein